MIAIRYLVNDVDSSVEFYTSALGFTLVQKFGPAMAILERSGVRLWLAGPNSSAAKPMQDGSKPSPGGWNRFVIQVTDMSAFVSELESKQVKFRNAVVTGPAGSQVLIEDPSGNLIEIFS